MQYQVWRLQKLVQKQASFKQIYFNAKFVPSKVDDSLGSGRYVMANGKSYLALPSTPEEFSETGALIDPDFLKRITLGLVSDFSQIIPNNPRWKGILIADAKLKDDGKAPAGVKASISNDAISWTESPSKDVIGYRIYSSSGQKVASVKSDSKLSHKVGKGGYYVVAVDVAGRESAPSDHVGVEEPEERRRREAEVDVEETIKPAEPSKEEKRKEQDKKIEEEKKKEEEKKRKEEEQKKAEKEKKEEEKRKKEEEKKKAEEEKRKEEEKKKNEEEENTEGSDG